MQTRDSHTRTSQTHTQTHFKIHTHTLNVFIQFIRTHKQTHTHINIHWTRTHIHTHTWHTHTWHSHTWHTHTRNYTSLTHMYYAHRHSSRITHAHTHTMAKKSKTTKFEWNALYLVMPFCFFLLFTLCWFIWFACWLCILQLFCRVCEFVSLCLSVVFNHKTFSKDFVGLFLILSCRERFIYRLFQCRRS